MVNLQPSIFVSYAHEDAHLAHAFAAALEREGARVWLDQGELLIGDSLIERISEAIAEFDFVAALVSTASVVSNWCRKEIALAMSKELRRGTRRVTVLPLRVGDVAMPASLSDVKWTLGEVREHCVERVDADHAEVGAPRGRLGGRWLELVADSVQIDLAGAERQCPPTAPEGDRVLPSTQL